MMKKNNSMKLKFVETYAIKLNAWNLSRKDKRTMNLMWIMYHLYLIVVLLKISENKNSIENRHHMIYAIAVPHLKTNKYIYLQCVYKYVEIVELKTFILHTRLLMKNIFFMFMFMWGVYMSAKYTIFCV